MGILSRSTRGRALAGACAAAALAFALPVPAHAATGYDRCPAGYACLFSEPDGQGIIAYFRYGSPDLRRQGLGDHVYSYWIRTDGRWCAYNGYGYGGALRLDTSSAAGQVNVVPSAARDIMSFRRVTASCYE